MSDPGSTPDLKFTPETLTAFLAEVFPQTADQIAVVALAPLSATARLKVGRAHLRPGGTVSGPSMFMLADCAFYMAVLGVLGQQALTVTTNCSINFMRKPEARDLMAEARILKLGKTLAVGDVTLTQDGQSGPVAHATMTYAIPPKQG